MPGVLAPLTLLDAEDGYGGRYGIVLDRRTGLMTPTLRVIPASHVAGRPAGRRYLGRQLGRLAGQPRFPARGAVGDRHRRYRARARLDPVRFGRRRARPRVAAGRPADHGPARPGRSGGRGRRRHAGEHHVRPEGVPGRARGPDGRCRRGRPHHARPGVSAGHLRGDRPGPGQRGRDRRRGPHRLRPGRPRRGQPHPGPAARRAPGLAAELGRRRARRAQKKSPAATGTTAASA